MASTKEAVSFDEIIQKARQRRKNQALTDKFFDKSRRSSAPASGPGSLAARASKQAPAPGSLASRVGVGKRSVSAASRKPAPAPAKPAPAKPPSYSNIPPRAPRAQRAKEERMLSAIQSNNNTINHNPPPYTIPDERPGINIKGKASAPCVVIGSNFAPGTTAADIESALVPVGGEMISCLILAAYPVVVAEMTFAEKRGAENVVATFNNQKADGRVLHVRIKEDINAQKGSSKNGSSIQFQSSFNNAREQADRQRRESRRAEPSIQDGRYGFPQT